MELKKDYFEVVDAYFSGDLKLEDRVKFEQELQINIELKQVYDNYLLAKKISSSFIELDVRDKIETIKDKDKILKIGLITLLITIVLSLLFYYYKSKNNLQNNNIKRKELIIAQLIVKPISEGIRGVDYRSPEYHLAVRYFQNNIFDSAITIFNKLNLQEQDITKLNEYKAHCYLNLGHYEEAKKYFKALRDTASSSIYVIEEAQYNLILIELLNDNKAQARQLYNQLQHKEMISDSKRRLLQELLE